MNELSTVGTLIEQNQNPQVVIGLVNPKTPVNVAGIMRASGCYQVNQVLYTGKRYEYAAMHETQYEVDKQQASKTIPLIGVDDLLAQVDEDTQIVCVDLVEGAIPLPNFVHPDKAIYIFGPEDGTIPQAIIDKADSVVYVPTVGCMNLAASVNVLLYDRLAKSKTHATDNVLIKQSRDNNNRTRIKHTTSL